MIELGDLVHVVLGDLVHVVLGDIVHVVLGDLVHVVFTADTDLLKMVPVEILLNFKNYFRTLKLGL